MFIRQTLSLPENGRKEVVAPRLFVAGDALDKLLAYVNGQRGHAEIAGWAYVKRHGTDYYLDTATDVFITRQTVTIGSADSDGHSLALAFERAVRENREHELRLQWHSHPDKAYFSHIDRTNIENFGETFEWLISLVTNRDGVVRARFDLFHPVRVGVEMEIIRHAPVDSAVTAEVAADIGRNVTIQQPPKLKPNK